MHRSIPKTFRINYAQQANVDLGVMWNSSILNTALSTESTESYR